MNLTYYSKIMFSFLLVSSLTMQAVKIEEINPKKVIQNLTNNSASKTKIKGVAKIISGLGLSALVASGYYWLYKNHGTKFLLFPFDESNRTGGGPAAAGVAVFLFQLWLACNTVGIAGTSLGAYLIYNGIKDLQSLKNQPSTIPKKSEKKQSPNPAFLNQ